MPRPCAVAWCPPRRFKRAANVIANGATERLDRAVGWLPSIGATIHFEISQQPKAVPALDDDYGYRLRIDDAVGVHIEAHTEWGCLAALATLCQLAGAETLAVRQITDEPRFPWRGLMIDTVRHFISPATLKSTLDAMWFYKLNVLHLHLTDDQGFRFRSRRYPELASDEAYSGDELAALVAYAADRGIRVVPELDVPGHTAWWVAKRSDWGLPGSATLPSTRFGIHQDCLNVANPDVCTAVDALLGELAEIFPDEFLHFGGDEATSIEDELQATFHRRVVDTVNRLGKRAIGWDECLHSALPKHTAIQAWRGMAARDVALAAGFDCVVSAPYYLDLFYPADVHYAFSPDGDSAAAEEAMLRHPRLAHVRSGLAWMARFASFPDLPGAPDGGLGRVLGGEACLWTELVDDQTLATRIWSRMPALAERFWSDADASSQDLLERLAASRRLLAERGIVAEDSNASEEFPSLTPLLEMLEPVKWYRRLLGSAEFERRVNGIGGSVEDRPYNATTPLRRIVDRLAPESLASRRAEADLAAGAPMQKWIAGWRQQRIALAEYPALLEELGDASAALAEIAAIVAGESNADASPLAGPFGEYLLPIAYAVASRR